MKIRVNSEVDFVVPLFFFARTLLYQPFSNGLSLYTHSISTLYNQIKFSEEHKQWTATTYLKEYLPSMPKLWTTNFSNKIPALCHCAQVMTLLQFSPLRKR